MKRDIVPIRPDWRELHIARWFNQDSCVSQPTDWDKNALWQEGVCYGFSTAQIDTLAQATQDLHAMCMEAAGEMIRRGNYGAQMGIPDEMIPYIEKSWNRRDPSLYGRFDLAYDGINPPKMIEFNGDYCGTLLEAGSLQFAWAKATGQRMQFNNIEPDIESEFHRMRRDMNLSHLYLMADYNSPEDAQTIDYVAKIVQGTGIQATRMDMNEVRWSDGNREIRDPGENRVDTLFMAYSWDILAGDEFGKEFIKHDPATFIEPPWRMLLSSKGLLCTLWEMFPGHPNLLPASADPGKLSGDLVRKPVWGLQGHDVSIIRQGEKSQQDHALQCIYQAYSPLPQFMGYRALTRSWVVGDRPSGISMAEHPSDIVDGTAKFVPHCIY